MDETTTDSTGSGWESWIQRIGGQVIGAAANAQYTQPYEIQKMRIQALGERGYYTEGQPGTQRQPAQGINPMVLMGGALLLVVLLATRKG